MQLNLYSISKKAMCSYPTGITLRSVDRSFHFVCMPTLFRCEVGSNNHILLTRLIITKVPRELSVIGTSIGGQEKMSLEAGLGEE